MHPSFSSNPSETPRHYFRNLIDHLEKTLLSSKELNSLQNAMGDLINASRDMSWIGSHHDTYRKEEGEKALSHLFSEFKRYIFSLEKDPKTPLKDVMDALKEVKRISVK